MHLALKNCVISYFFLQWLNIVLTHVECAKITYCMADKCEMLHYLRYIKIQGFACDYSLSLQDILCFAGHDVFATGLESGSIKLNMENMSESAKMNYQVGVFNLLVTIPIWCAGFQLFVWSRFTLHTKRLQWVKSVRSNVFKYATV